MAARRTSRRRVTRRKRRVTRRKRVTKRRRTKKKRVVRRRRKARKSIRGSKRQVFNGTKVKTNGGLTKTDVFKNKQGLIVSKKAHQHGRRIYKKNISKWTKAFMQARKNLGISGFVPCKKGSKVYKETRRIYGN